MKVAFVLGSANGVHQEYQQARRLVKPDAVLAVNDMIERFNGPLFAAVSFHGEKIDGWLNARKRCGYEPPEHIVIAKEWEDWYQGVTPKWQRKPRVFRQYFPGQVESGSSGLFAVKVALVNFKFDRVICCGMPMDHHAGYVHRPGRAWFSALRHRKGWEQALPHLKGKVFSMSGWTSRLLGKPEG